MVRGLLGVELVEISAFYFLDYVKSGLGMGSLLLDNASGAQYMRLREGGQNPSNFKNETGVKSF